MSKVCLDKSMFYGLLLLVGGGVLLLGYFQNFLSLLVAGACAAILYGAFMLHLPQRALSFLHGLISKK